MTTTIPTDLDRLGELLPLVRRHHDHTQVDRFITLHNGLTLWGCLKQALRELDARLPALLDGLVKLERLRGSLIGPGETTPLEKVRDEVELLRATRSLEEQAGEFLRFYAQACSLVDTIGPFDEASRDAMELETWYVTLKAQGAEELVSYGRVRGSTVRSAAALPEPWRAKLLVELSSPNQEALHRWLLELRLELPPFDPPVMTLGELESELLGMKGRALPAFFGLNRLIESR